MADIRAFRGFRYDLGQVGPLSGLIAPPYDVIDAELQAKLYDSSPHNAIRVELTKDEPGRDKYAVAAQTLRDWLDSGVLQQDSTRALYAYEQEFAVENRRHVRRGFFARVRLEPFGSGRIFPHEQTLSGPKADRLKLYHSTRFNISPIFGLYPDDGSTFAKLEAVTRKLPPIEATDHLGVVNRLWPITDQATITAVMGLMGPKPIFIADGHHRYETGLKYRDEVQPADADAPANFCLMLLVGMSDPGLIIQPTHRLVSGLMNLSRRELQERLSPHFEIVEQCGSAGDCWETIEADGGQNILGFGGVADGQWLAARLSDTAIMDRLAADQSAEWRGLGVSILHKLVLEQLLPGGACRYVHRIDEVVSAIEAGSCQLACLVPPAAMSHVASIAGQGEKMPPKSTYFYPKIVTGMVFNSLAKD